MDQNVWSKYFLTGYEVLVSYQKVSVRSLTLVIFAVVWVVCGWQPGYESVIPLLSFSLIIVFNYTYILFY